MKGTLKAEMRVGPDHPKNLSFLCFFSFVFSSVYIFWRKWGGEREAPLGRNGSPWIAVGDAGRG